MTPRQKGILHAFDTYVFGGMRAEIDWAIRGRALLLATLGLVAYTEVLGGIITGNLGQRRRTAENFRAFLPYLGPEYLALDAKVDLYDQVRNGLVHEYLVKGDATFWPEAPAPWSCAIVSSPGGPTQVNVSDYRNDLFRGAQRLRDEILEDRPDRVAHATRALTAIGLTIP